jgi:hypothetical protein
VGNVQSGKTYHEINYCYSSKYPVIFIVRNINADQLQLKNRFNEHAISNVHLLKTCADPLECLQTKGVLITLCNQKQVTKILTLINGFNKPYNVCIDEIDYSIKSHNESSQLDKLLSELKSKANFVLGATATPIALFTSEKKDFQIKKVPPQKNYHGIETLDVQFVESCILRSESDFPSCDMEAMDTIYEHILEKDRAVLLHTVVKDRTCQYKIQQYLTKWYPQITTLVYNGDGIKVICTHRGCIPFTEHKMMNCYNQLINKYYILEENGTVIHYFQNYSISEVLQLFVNDHYNHTHISIISGHLASRGISFVSSDYSLHLTDQYLYVSKKTHGENLLQSLRILGCYERTSGPLTLWCSEKTWKAVLLQNKLINQLTENLHGCNWKQKITEIKIHPPNRALTRRKLCNYRFRKEFIEINFDENKNDSN